MGLEKILSISGKPGLYELTAQTRGGFVAKSIVDEKKVAVNVRQNVSLLSEIAIYTYTEEVPLGEIFKKISEKENGGEAIDNKASKKELEAYFAEILPDYDVDRVYQSDIKKIIQWYNLLVKYGFTDFSKEDDKDSENPTKDSSESALEKASEESSENKSNESSEKTSEEESEKFSNESMKEGSGKSSEDSTEGKELKP